METPHKPRIHRAESLYLHGSPGKAISLDEYIETARTETTAADLHELGEFREEILAKLETPQARQHHDLLEGVHLLLEFATSESATQATDPLPKALGEATVALRYFLKGVDLIPDMIPEIGLTDDARLVARVLARNPEFRRAG